MVAHLADVRFAGAVVVLMLAIAAYILRRREWLLGAAAVGLSVGIAMIAASREALWSVSRDPGDIVFAVSCVALALGSYMSTRRRKRHGAGPEAG